MNSPFGTGWGNYALEGIVEAQLPDAISLWPQTPGWILVGALLFYAAVRLVVKKVKDYWKNRYRRAALTQLSHLQNRFLSGDTAAARRIPALIKATALQAFPRHQVAALAGVDWEAFLDRTYEGPSFAGNCPGVLYALSYAPLQRLDPVVSDRLWSQLRLWISAHRGPYDRI